MTDDRKSLVVIRNLCRVGFKTRKIIANNNKTMAPSRNRMELVKSVKLLIKIPIAIDNNKSRMDWLMIHPPFLILSNNIPPKKQDTTVITVRRCDRNSFLLSFITSPST